MELQNRLVELRRERGLSQEALAEKLYVSRQTISNWERGQTYPELNSLLLLATYFDISLDNLIKGDFIEMQQTHDEEKCQLRKWLVILGVAIFSSSFIQPIGRFYDIVNFEILSSLILSFICYCLFRVSRLVRNHQLRTYNEILDFINTKEKRDSDRPAFWKEIKITAVLITIIWILIITGQALGSLLFYRG